MIIRKGSTRTVFIFRNYIIKIPRFKEYRLFLYGLLANIQERKWSGYHRYLAKVLYASKNGLILIMESVDIFFNNDELWKVVEKQIKESLRNDDLKEFLLSDLKCDNWGTTKNGDLKKVDYGN